jgi:hypothetical protein
MYIAKVIDRDNEDEVLSFGDLIMTIVSRNYFDKIHGVLNSVKKNKDILTQKLVVI